MRLIDADEVLKALGEAPLVRDEYTDEYELGQLKQWEQDVEAITALPTIETEPVRRGRWEIGCECMIRGGVRKMYKYCSVCGEKSIESGNYCPWCGAKMETDDE